MSHLLPYIYLSVPQLPTATCLVFIDVVPVESISAGGVGSWLTGNSGAVRGSEAKISDFSGTRG